MSADPMQYCGVNHVALVARDMAETVAFYRDILEMPLLKTLDLPGGRGQHFFFDCGNGDSIAFFWFPNAPEAAPGIASMHPDFKKVGSQTAHGSMNHLAISIPADKFDAYVERLRAKGLAVRVINHGDGDEHSSPVQTESTWVRSMYFRDPNGIHFELAALVRPYSPADVSHDPVNAAGQPVPLSELAAA